MRKYESKCKMIVIRPQAPPNAQRLGMIGEDAGCEGMAKDDEEDADRSRTDFKPGCNRLPGRPAPASESNKGWSGGVEPAAATVTVSHANRYTTTTINTPTR